MSQRRTRTLIVRWLVAVSVFSVGSLLAAIACDRWVSFSASARIFHSPADVPPRDVALVLGANPTTNGHPNLFFTARMDAAAALYVRGTVRHFIVSGDNHTAAYDEPSAMRDALIARGVPASSITLDFAGFRTLDSVLRAREVFGQSRLIIVSQEFHCARALYIAQCRGIDAVALAARSPRGGAALLVRAREVLARTVAVVDARILGTQPHFPGPPEPILLSAGSPS